MPVMRRSVAWIFTTVPQEARGTVKLPMNAWPPACPGSGSLRSGGRDRGPVGVAADQGGVPAVPVEQLVVRTALGCAAAVQDDDLVRVADGGEAVRDGEGGAAGRERVDRFLHGVFRTGVERAGRLVEDQDRRVAQDRAGDGEALLLAAREAVAALADEGVVAVGEGGDVVVDLRGAGRRLYLLVGGLRLGEAEVVGDGGVEEVGLLGYHADRSGQRVEVQVADADSSSVTRPPVTS